jgi:hypothetical protein
VCNGRIPVFSSVKMPYVRIKIGIAIQPQNLLHARQIRF